MENFRLVKKGEKGLFVFESDEPAILIVVASGTVGSYHVIKDMPGPQYEHYFMEPKEIKDKFGVII